MTAIFNIAMSNINLEDFVLAAFAGDYCNRFSIIKQPACKVFLTHYPFQILYLIWYYQISRAPQ